MAPRTEVPSAGSSSLPATLVAVVLVFARQHLVQLGLCHPSVAQILDATGAKKSRVYELLSRLPTLLKELVGPNGRPPKPRALLDHHVERALTRSVLAYMMDHPGCVSNGDHRRSYSMGFREHIVSLREDHADMELSVFAKAVHISYHTVQDWLRNNAEPMDTSAQPHNDNFFDKKPPPEKTAHISSVLDAWKRWEGSFVGFCEHVREHLRIPFGIAMIRTVLESHGVRLPKRRAGRSSSEENAIREQFKNFFPGAQWQGDGAKISFALNGVPFDFNFELMVDPASGAWVGMSVSDEEDSQAVIDAVQDGIQTTGDAPLAVLLDHRPSNHSDQVQEAFDEHKTRLILATKGRPQNKAHVEGSFGLFKQHAPPLQIQAGTLRDLARECLKLIMQVYGRRLNQKPRKDREHQSRLELHRQAPPTEEEFEAAKQSLKELQKRQEEAQKNREARTDPVVREMIDEALKRLELEDPKHRFRNSIATFHRDAIVDGIAIFEGKKKSGTLKPGVDARYLLGIVKNIHEAIESEAIMRQLIERRIEMQDRQFRLLEKKRLEIVGSNEGFRSIAREMVNQIIDSDRKVDRLFWGQTLGALVRAEPKAEWKARFQQIERRIRTSTGMTKTDKSSVIRQVAATIWPVS